jgi:hypothetical protein
MCDELIAGHKLMDQLFKSKQYVYHTYLYSYNKFRVNGLDNYSVHNNRPPKRKNILLYNKRERETFTKYKSIGYVQVNSEMMMTMISFQQYVSNNIIYELIVYYHHLWACHFALPIHTKFFKYTNRPSLNFPPLKGRCLSYNRMEKKVTRAVKFLNNWPSSFRNKNKIPKMKGTIYESRKKERNNITT